MIDVNHSLISKIDKLSSELSNKKKSTNEGVFNNPFDFQFEVNKLDGKLTSLSNFKSKFTKQLRENDVHITTTLFIKSLEEETKTLRKQLGEIEKNPELTNEYYRSVGQLNGRIDGNNALRLNLLEFSSELAKDDARNKLKT